MPQRGSAFLGFVVGALLVFFAMTALGAVGFALVARHDASPVCVAPPVPAPSACAARVSSSAGPAEAFLDDLAAGRWAAAAHRCVPALAPRIEDEFLRHRDLWSGARARQTASSWTEAGANGAPARRRCDVAWTLGTPDGKTRRVSVATADGRVANVWVDGKPVLETKEAEPKTWEEIEGDIEAPAEKK
jgi:hypothetical protein